MPASPWRVLGTVIVTNTGQMARQRCVRYTAISYDADTHAPCFAIAIGSPNNTIKLKRMPGHLADAASTHAYTIHD